MLSKYPRIWSKLNCFLDGVSSLRLEPVTFKIKGHGTVLGLGTSLKIIVGSSSFPIGLMPGFIGIHSDIFIHCCR